MPLPRVSVVMPVYNVERYVAEAIRSVLAQSYADFELLIIDDGGQDRSIEICRGFDDRRIRIISQANCGLAGARNTGIAEARGEVIALLDSDDRWLPDKLMLHMIHLDSMPDVGVSYSGSRFIDSEGKPLRQAQRPKLNQVSAADIFCRNPVGNGSAPLIRRSMLNRIAFLHPDDPKRLCYFDESFRQSEDIELWVRLALKAQCRFDGIKPLLTEYRIVPGGLSANVIRQYETWLRMYAKVEAYAPDFIAEHGPRARAYQLRYLARRSVQLGDGSFALALMRDALATSLRPLIEQPIKTGLTLGAAILARWIKPAQLAAISRRWTGAEVIA
jgi:glycosyltransferase involved in cell wall biosynthesis